MTAREPHGIITHKMTVLGIDTSLRSTGYGVLSVHGSRLAMVDCGNIRNQPRAPLTECLREMDALLGGVTLSGEEFTRLAELLFRETEPLLRLVEPPE